MKKYILNSAVITSPGMYEYNFITVEEMKKWLEAGDWVSTIGYEETAKALQELTGIKIPVNRQQIKMKQGDEALIFRLTCRLDNPQLKGYLTTEFIKNNCEIGILKKIK
jgi:hypothetical protein